MRTLIVICCITLSCLLASCISPSPVPTKTDECGCLQPPSDVFTAAGVDFEFAQSTFGDIVTGDLSVTTKPEVITLASKAVTDERIRTYMRCRARKCDNYTPEQIVYFDLLAAFIASNPSTDEVLKWKAESPFPN